MLSPRRYLPPTGRGLLSPVLLVLALLFPLLARGEGPWTLNLYFENDLFGESDQNYTNGIRASWVSPDLEHFERDPSLPQWVRSINKGLRIFHQLKDSELESRNIALSVGQLMYTPSDLERTDLIVEERPYAGFLYGSVAYHTRSDDILDIMELTLGVVGPASYAREAQDFIHKLRDFRRFKGWDNQLRNELGLILLYERKQRVLSPPASASFGHDLILHRGIALGNVATYLNAGAEYRFGWDLPDDFGTSAVRPGGDNSSPGRNDPRLHDGRSSLHFFLSSDVRLVARDIFLDGNTFADSHSVDKNWLVADLSAGISATRGRWKLSFAKVFRSKEYKRQRDPHSYGSVSLSYTW